MSTLVSLFYVQGNDEISVGPSVMDVVPRVGDTMFLSYPFDEGLLEGIHRDLIVTKVSHHIIERKDDPKVYVLLGEKDKNGK